MLTTSCAMLKPNGAAKTMNLRASLVWVGSTNSGSAHLALPREEASLVSSTELNALPQ